MNRKLSNNTPDCAALSALGPLAGLAQYYQYAELANRHTPQLHSVDIRGHRLDQLEFDPAWH